MVIWLSKKGLRSIICLYQTLQMLFFVVVVVIIIDVVVIVVVMLLLFSLTSTK